MCRLRNVAVFRQKVLKLHMRFLLVLSCLMYILISCAKGPSCIQAPFDGYTSEIDVSTLIPKQPRFYSLSIEGKNISFFLLMVNGEIQSYFNACKECYPKKLGFSFEEGYMKCRSCNERWPLESLQDGIGGCYPIPLKGVLKGDKYVITQAALKEGMQFF
ncbi:MAG: Fe-S-containing protein [Dissulfurispiraceae bacterium]